MCVAEGGRKCSGAPGRTYHDLKLEKGMKIRPVVMKDPSFSWRLFQSRCVPRVRNVDLFLTQRV